MTTDFSAPQQFVHSDHGRLAYWRFGKGPDVVFIHGWPLHGATFRRIIPAIAKRYTCHVFDLPGTGHTEWAEGAPFGLWEHADTLHDALQKIDIEDYSMVAHDSGGTIARLLATKTPGRVQAIILGNTEIPGHMPDALRWGKLMVKLPGVVGALKLITRSRRVVDEMFRGCFADLSELDTDFSDLFVEPLTHDTEYIRGQLRLVEHLDWEVVTSELAGVHQQISAPVLFIWGDRDPWFPWKIAKEMVESFAGPPAEVALIGGGKLFVHEDFADAFARQTIDFLDRVVDR